MAREICISIMAQDRTLITASRKRQVRAARVCVCETHSDWRPCTANAGGLMPGVGGVAGRAAAPFFCCLSQAAASEAAPTEAPASDDPALKQLSSEAAGLTVAAGWLDLSAATVCLAGLASLGGDAATLEARSAASASAYAASTAAACASAAREPAV